MPFLWLVVFGGHVLSKHHPQMNPCIDLGQRRGLWLSISWTAFQKQSLLHLGGSSLLELGGWRVFFAEFCYSKILGLNRDALCRHYEKWGPSAHTCINLTCEPMVEYDLSIWATEAAAYFVKYSGSQVNHVDWESIPHSDILFSIQPEGPGMQQRQRKVIKVATKHLNQIVAEAANAHQQWMRERDKHSKPFRIASPQPRPHWCATVHKSLRKALWHSFHFLDYGNALTSTCGIALWPAYDKSAHHSGTTSNLWFNLCL